MAGYSGKLQFGVLLIHYKRKRVNLRADDASPYDLSAYFAHARSRHCSRSTIISSRSKKSALNGNVGSRSHLRDNFVSYSRNNQEFWNNPPAYSVAETGLSRVRCHAVAGRTPGIHVDARSFATRTMPYSSFFFRLFLIIHSSKLCVKGICCLCTHRANVLAGPQMVRSSTLQCAVLLRALLVASLVCIATVRYL